ncbi:hypothetical protein BDK92_4605 [Micromonospora pisi]|uniref:Uncharacterized protein n=1 Tax=Micromonospora pisi TaxID=589240 RepID=A0A495JMN5_9ACTN|nr:hypothetical protein [Micromonospora pisi]RKR90237.1 hypothetical protein BDK92_4605 [Micromonospora pisi]
MTDQAPPPPVPPAAPVPGTPVPPPFDSAPVSAPPPAKKSPVKKIVSVLVVIVVAVAVKFGLGTVLGGEDKTAEAKVGDCLAALPEMTEGEEKAAPNAKVVDCTSTEAIYNVVARIENQTEEQASNSTECEQYAAEGEEYAMFTAIPTGGTGYLLCLKPKKA